MHIFNKAACGLPLLLSLMSTNGWATTLAEALSAAENYSAELSANDHQVNALKNMADSAMQLPDPKLKFGIENVPLGGNNAGRLTREGMTMQRVGVMQDYVSSTKRERKADSITAEARQTAANADVIRARLQRETAQAWLALALAQKSLRSVQTLISETSRQIDVQKAGVSSASASPSSVLDVQLALNAMKNEQDNARRDVQIAQARLLQFTGKEIRDISGPLPRIERLPADEADLMAGIKLHPRKRNQVSRKSRRSPTWALRFITPDAVMIMTTWWGSCLPSICLFFRANVRTKTTQRTSPVPMKPTIG